MKIVSIIVGILSAFVGALIFYMGMSMVTEGSSWDSWSTLCLIGILGSLIILADSVILIFYKSKTRKVLMLFFSVVGFLFSLFILMFSIALLFSGGKVQSDEWGMIGIIGAPLMLLAAILAFIKILRVRVKNTFPPAG
ncbi:MAG: hypothetical protein V1709_11275 [Planctomycetota bacterium]